MRQPDGDVGRQPLHQSEIFRRVRVWTPREQCEDSGYLVADEDRRGHTRSQISGRPRYLADKPGLGWLAQDAVILATDELRGPLARTRIQAVPYSVVGREQ